MQTVQFFFCVQKTCPDCTRFLYRKKTCPDWTSFFLSAVTICFLYNKIRLEKSVQDKQGAAQFMEFTPALTFAPKRCHLKIFFFYTKTSSVFILIFIQKQRIDHNENLISIKAIQKYCFIFALQFSQNVQMRIQIM